MKKFISIGLIIFLFIAVIGAATNPSYEEYKAWYKQQAQEGYAEYKSGEETTQFEKSVMSFFADMISDTSIIREDHKIYSLFTSTDENYNYKVLGLFNNFFVIEDSEKIDIN